VRWTPPAGAAMTLVYALDPELAGDPHGRATRCQTLVLDPRAGAVDLRAAHLAPGRRYVVAVSVADRALHRLASRAAPSWLNNSSVRVIIWDDVGRAPS
jgi:hypothetical protein